jgi:hypothetical protein
LTDCQKVLEADEWLMNAMLRPSALAPDAIIVSPRAVPAINFRIMMFLLPL